MRLAIQGTVAVGRDVNGAIRSGRDEHRVIDGGRCGEDRSFKALGHLDLAEQRRGLFRRSHGGHADQLCRCRLPVLGRERSRQRSGTGNRKTREETKVEHDAEWARAGVAFNREGGRGRILRLPVLGPRASSPASDEFHESPFPPEGDSDSRGSSVHEVRVS